MQSTSFYQYRSMTIYFTSLRQPASSTMQESPKKTTSVLPLYGQPVFYQHRNMLEYYMSLRQLHLPLCENFLGTHHVTCDHIISNMWIHTYKDLLWPKNLHTMPGHLHSSPNWRNYYKWITCVQYIFHSDNLLGPFYSPYKPQDSLHMNNLRTMPGSFTL